MEPSAFMRRHGDDLPAVHPASAPPGGGDPSYFTHLEYPNWMLAHIAIMVIAWVFLLPIAVMLSLARARFRALVAQFVFFTANAVGLLCGTVYNSRTPDLYPNNAHHKIGWLATWVMAAQALVGLARAYAPERPAEAARPEMPVRPPHLKRASDASSRFSRDSGYGIELSSPHSTGPPSPDAESARSPERGGMLEPMPEDEDAEEKRGLLGHNRVDRYLSRKLRTAGASRAMRLINLAYSVVDRTILLLGFIALATGVVTYGGFFQGHMVFTGLAHFIKGGIFVWYGFVTLGRVMGCFAALGWSWNVKPPASIVGGRAAGAPSAEFVESLIIFLYGSTNMWLERLGKLTPEWSSTDLEHVSISIMFFGGGLCGMLLESRRIRDVLNSAFVGTPAPSAAPGFDSKLENWHAPRTYGFSLNPLPALVLMLLGMMMSGHHQQSMVSTMLHKSWGSLFAAAALFRGLTYVLTYLAPPTSYLPARPPSEIIVSFCLISGGLLFMGSNGDFVRGMEHYGLDAMFLFTVTMGLTAFLMAWEIVVLAIEGWAVRRERARAYR